MSLASVSRGNPFQEGITAVMPTNNQPLIVEKANRFNEKVDGNHLKASMRM